MTVELEQKNGGLRKSFEITHAERLMNLPDNGGWGIAENSEYQFNTENGTITKRNKRDTKSAD